MLFFSAIFWFISTILFYEIMIIYIFWIPNNTELIQLGFLQLLIGLVMLTLYLTKRRVSYFQISSINENQNNKNENNDNNEYTNQIRKRYCYKCQIVKPPRCHHCKTCKQCVLRMDHHFPLANTCIGQNNYKQFFCLILYQTITIVYYSITFLFKLISISEFGTIEIFILSITQIGTIIHSILSIIFLVFHIKLIIQNKTTLEYMEKKPGNYDQGLINNVNELLGSQFWLIPF